ncbi:MAG TPA: fibronectin type III domain-containing protein [Candidatus Limnocylindrales bacterium]
MADAAIKRLGTFLADLTQDKPPDQIHAEILVRLRDPQLDLDHRLAGIYLHVKDFVPIWTAIRNGVSLPASSWETVVLPVVVHFSPATNVKPNLESVTSLFLTARGTRALDADPAPDPPPLLDEAFERQTPPPPVPPPPTVPPTVRSAKPSTEPEREPAREPEAAAAERAVVAARTGRRWVPQAAAVTVVALAALALWTGRDIGGGGATFSALSPDPVTTTPSVTPSPTPSPTPSETSTASPTPGVAQPAAQTSGPPRVPGAPTGLTSPRQDRTSITLSWRAPRDASNVAFYKVFRDGTATAQTSSTAATVTGLSPGTAYTFSVRAYNRSGQQSPLSNSITVQTPADPVLPPPPTFNAPDNVAFGSVFSVHGSNWPCTEVEIRITGRLVEIGKAPSGSFNEQIDVHDIAEVPGWVTDISSGEPFQLTQGQWDVAAACPGGPPITKQITVN